MPFEKRAREDASLAPRTASEDLPSSMKSMRLQSPRIATELIGSQEAISSTSSGGN